MNMKLMIPDRTLGWNNMCRRRRMGNTRAAIYKVKFVTTSRASNFSISKRLYTVLTGYVGSISERSYALLPELECPGEAGTKEPATGALQAGCPDISRFLGRPTPCQPLGGPVLAYAPTVRVVKNACFEGQNHHRSIGKRKYDQGLAWKGRSNGHNQPSPVDWRGGGVRWLWLWPRPHHHQHTQPHIPAPLTHRTLRK